jgi:hypothetical protein
VSRGSVPRILIVTAVVAGLAAAVGGHAAGQSVSGLLWATVNSCSPGSVGVRASLPGDGTSERMRVRFTAQWYSPASQGWVPVTGVASSPWLDAGSARYAYGQAGWTFAFDRSGGGRRFLVRGRAQMQWLSGGRVVRSAERVTRADAVGAGASRASCTIG